MCNDDNTYFRLSTIADQYVYETFLLSTLYSKLMANGDITFVHLAVSKEIHVQLQPRGKPQTSQS